MLDEWKEGVSEYAQSHTEEREIWQTKWESGKRTVEKINQAFRGVLTGTCTESWLSAQKRLQSYAKWGFLENARFS